MNNKKLILATPLYPPRIGGPATYTVMLEKNLPAYGIDVTVVPFTPYSQFPLFVRHILYAIALLSRAWRGHSIMALDAVSVGLPAMLVARLLRKRFILKVVGDHAWEQGVQRGSVTVPLDTYLTQPFSYGWFVSLLARIERVTARSAHTLIVPSEYLRGLVLSWDVPEHRIVVIPNVANVNPLTENREILRRSLNIGQHTILTAGRLVLWKKIDVIVSALSELKKTIPDLTLLIAGEGPDRPRLQDLVREFALGSQVRFLGSLHTENLHQYMCASDAFVLVSTYEGLSHVLIEALALGVPIIASDAGGNREALADGSCGYLIAPEDSQALVGALTTLFSDQKKTALYVARGLEHAKRYTAHAHLQALCAYLL